jgi:flavin-dependent dehydrogenase
MSPRADLVVLGGGPAGAAAAIWAAGAGLRVTLLERASFPRPRPGETLHPGVEVVLARLGVAEAVQAASPLRPFYQVVSWATAPRDVPYGSDGRGPWRAFQIGRDVLDALLLERARQLGTTVLQPAPRARPVVHDGRVVGVRTTDGHLAAPFVIDATGANGCLRWELGLGLAVRSPPLTASYGYVRRSDGAPPRLEGDEHGWTWTAQISPTVAHWCRLPFRGGRSRVTAPPSLRRYAAVGGVHAANVTWRSVRPVAGPGYLLAGDAAFVLDPAASHGVLRALLSGVRAAQVVLDVLAGRADQAAAADAYEAWTRAWFEHDVARLNRLYEQISPHWPLRSAVHDAYEEPPARGDDEATCPRR